MTWPRCFILGADEASEVLKSKNKNKLALRGLINHSSLTLLLGDGEIVEVKLNYFEPKSLNFPNFTEFSIVDYGGTLRFGDYEASVSTMLRDLNKEIYKKYKL